LILSPLEMDRPILTPPGTPPERVAALRKAFSAAMRDPGFIAEAAKQNIEIKEISGEHVTEVLRRAYTMPPEVIKAATEAMSLTGTTQ
jgi:tripartite-type tricarboxylate transporter receptor subunit TctC